ncbi:DMT family transporter [Vibrio furnissii]|uniref:Transporter family-2 protein n=1 Tax=Vibrio furnissii TaxID=29494 RepID=A0A0Q2RVJ2_VIBFU|nr:DMT family transporter [Vibrio furnissii]EEX40690.1 integral membrane protein [Vibrio furnissii CIP 102972]KQH88086.1 hypothetical protein AMR76_02020 [Vibrio furnissii]MCG6234637.1 DMT family transporter [Vibrio furnissii]MCG6257896.1 DMT family transporter [Vibrio furnissii]QDC95361.1 DMT family transporter [Vibrio furnissii]
MHILFFLMALAGGAGLSIQAAINSRLSSGVGGQPLIAAFISFSVGALCLGIAAAFYANWNGFTVNIVQQSPWKWLGGLIGAAFVFTTIFLAPKIGITNVMFLFIMGQLATGLCIDRFGLLEMPIRAVHWWHVMGLGIMLLGLICYMYGNRIFLK